MKGLMTTALVIATIAMSAQGKMKKACIKMEKDENGTVTKIDTCVTAATEEELQQKLNALGFGDMPEVPPVPGVPPAPPVPPLPPLPPGEEGKEVTMTKVIVIDDGEESGSGRKNARARKNKKGEAYEYSYSSSDGEGAKVIVMDGNGNVIKSDGKDGNVVIKKMKPGEKPDEEIEKIMKEHGVNMKDGEAHQIIIKNEESKNGKESKEVKVFVFNKMEVKDLSAEDKKRLPESANKSLEKAAPMTNLSMSPNPTDDACTISYKTSSKEPLLINVYDMEGRTVYTETEKNVNDQVSKTISLKELGKGIYFVHLTQGKQSEVRKIIVK